MPFYRVAVYVRRAGMSVPDNVPITNILRGRKIRLWTSEEKGVAMSNMVDLETLARETAMSLTDGERMGYHMDPRNREFYADRYRPVILSALNAALRGKEAECSACKTACEHHGVEVAEKDAQIAALTAENAKMRALMQEAIDNCETCRDAPASCARCVTFAAALAAPDAKGGTDATAST
jgi:hypothetical protein